MRRTFPKILLGVVLSVIVFTGAFDLLILGVTRQLPGQTPVFDTTPPADPGPVGPKGVLIFAKTNGFRHESIEPGIRALRKAGRQKGWDVRTTENGAFFTDDYLRRFRVVVFLSTTGDVLTPAQKKAFERFVETGGGYAGIHAASDTEHGWVWYGRLLGTHFRDHPVLPNPTPNAELITDDRTHPATRHLPARWRKTDEWYDYRQSVRGNGHIRVLLSLNEASYPAVWSTNPFGWITKMGGDHPVSWTNTVGNGRVFYTGLGHTPETFTDRYAMPHIVAGIAWAGRFE